MISEEELAIGNYISGLGYVIEHNKSPDIIRVKEKGEEITVAWPYAVVIAGSVLEIHTWLGRNEFNHHWGGGIRKIYLGDHNCLDKLKEILNERNRSTMERNHPGVPKL